MFTGWRLLFAALVLTASPIVARTDGAPTAETSDPLRASHFKQTGTIDISGAGRASEINTFCLDPHGRLLVAVGGTQLTTRISSKGREIDKQTVAGAIRVYSQEGQLLETWPLDFVPQALNVGPDGQVFVAGVGKIARLDAHGNVAQSGATPQITSRQEFEAAIQVELDERNKRNVEMFAQQVERAQELVDRLEAKPADERSQIDALRLNNSKRQLAVLKQQTELLASSTQIDLGDYMTYKLKVPGLAVTKQDVFVAVNAVKGYGYEVWRLDHDFANPIQICTGLLGCCGQMDIQAYGGDLYVAENSRHRVCRFDREGKEVWTWGESDRNGKEGFEGCCNPMNLRFTPNGDILTAESGVGVIKRFSPKGEYQGVVGKARLQGGCKHVAIAATPDGSHLYMLDITQERIAVLSPTSAPQATPDSGPDGQPAATDAEKASVLQGFFNALFGASASDDN